MFEYNAYHKINSPNPHSVNSMRTESDLATYDKHSYDTMRDRVKTNHEMSHVEYQGDLSSSSSITQYDQAHQKRSKNHSPLSSNY